ncbi:MAG: hypothetical protein JST95_11945 [Bacteroidetes bacterium]|nr:hypothetical protein [Bacteroidota bacterium]
MAVLFIIIYAIAFDKKMSLLLFPYNAMYSVDFNHNNTGEVYACKQNGTIIPITGKWYWKKDFLETSLRGFVHYVEDTNRVFLNHYILYRFSNPIVQQYLVDKLTPGKIKPEKWVTWYTCFAGRKIEPGDSLEIIRYSFDFDRNGFQLIDSVTIWKNFRNGE